MPRREETLRVRAREGLVMPIPTGVAVDYAGRSFTTDASVEVRRCGFVRRRLRAGDLVEVETGRAAPSRTARESKE